jgi:hypothetical protein
MVQIYSQKKFEPIKKYISFFQFFFFFFSSLLPAVADPGAYFSAKNFLAEISVEKSRRVWGSIDINFDPRSYLLLLNQKR